MHTLRVPSLNRLVATCCAAFALMAASQVHAQAQAPATPLQVTAEATSAAPQLTLQASAATDVQKVSRQKFEVVVVFILAMKSYRILPFLSRCVWPPRQCPDGLR